MLLLKAMASDPKPAAIMRYAFSLYLLMYYRDLAYNMLCSRNAILVFLIFVIHVKLGCILQGMPKRNCLFY